MQLLQLVKTSASLYQIKDCSHGNVSSINSINSAFL